MYVQPFVSGISGSDNEWTGVADAGVDLHINMILMLVST